MKKNICIPIFLFIFSASCKLSYQPQSVQYTGYKVSQPHKMDTSFSALLKPFSDSVHKRMATIVGMTGTTLRKMQPEGALGNVLADALLRTAEKKFNERIDAAFLNPGGIRKATVMQGPVTMGDIYELMPFDNLIAFQQVGGEVLQRFLDLTAARGGWPVSGLTMKIKNNRATNVMIGGKPIDANTSYNIVNSDYIVNGGDGCNMLKVVPSRISDYLVRDAFVDYFSMHQAAGKKIFAKPEGRVSYVQ